MPEELKGFWTTVQTERLKEILAQLDINDPAYEIVVTALKVSPITLDEEMQLYKALRFDGNLGTRAIDALVEKHLSLAITKAWDFRGLGVPYEDLIDAARQALISAAIAFSRNSRPSFYSKACDASVEGILEKLDELSIETVTLDELKALFQEGKLDAVEAMLTSLDSVERKIVETRIGMREDAVLALEKPTGFGDTFLDFKEALALRKLRRAKTN